MRQIFLALITILIILNLNAKIIEKQGNKRLKKLKTNSKNIYIGVSQRSNSLQDAYNSALSHAQNQIIQNLGVKAIIDISIDEVNTEFQDSPHNSISISKKNYISGIYSLKLKQDEVYWEKLIENGEIYYLAYVKVNFSIEHYKQDISKHYSQILDDLTISETEKDERFKRLIPLMKQLSDFDREFAHLSPLIPKSLYNEYLESKNSYQKEFYDCLEHLSLEQINKDERFPKEMYFSLSLYNKSLANFPLFLCSDNCKTLISNEQGIVSFSPAYSKFNKKAYILSFVPNPEEYFTLPQLHFTVYSPLYNENIRLAVQIDTEIAYEEFQQQLFEALSMKKFNISEKSADFTLKIKIHTKKDQRLSNVSKSVYNTSITVNLINNINSALVEEWTFPNKQFPDLKGIGRSDIEAKKNAVLLKANTNNGEFWYSLIQEIEQAIKRKKY